MIIGLLAAQRLGLVRVGHGGAGRARQARPAAAGGATRPRSSRCRTSSASGCHRSPGITPTLTTILRLSTAARDRTGVRLTYRSAAGEVTERLVDPYGVAFQSGHWYLVSWDHFRGAMRTFRLDRMIATEAHHGDVRTPGGLRCRRLRSTVDRRGRVRDSLRGPAGADPRRGEASGLAHRRHARSGRRTAPCCVSAPTTSTGLQRSSRASSAIWWCCDPPELRTSLRTIAARLRAAGAPAATSRRLPAHPPS